MTLQDIYNALEMCRKKLEDGGVDDLTAIELNILTSRLKKQLLLRTFDPLQELDNVIVADVKNLPDLVVRVDEVIKSEEKRSQLVGTILAIAKKGLAAAGVPLPP